MPTAQEFEIVKDLCKLLKPLKDLTKLLSGTNYVTVNHLYPVLFSLFRYEYSQMIFTNGKVNELKDELIRLLSKRFKYVLSFGLFQAITFLDPQYRKFEFIKVG